MKIFIVSIALLLFGVNVVQAATAEELKARYKDPTTKKIKILIVPGHDDEYWGTEFRNTREADVVVAIGQQLYTLLSRDPRFEVIITRTQQGYTKTFSDYFTNNRQAITDFLNTKIAEAQQKIQTGQTKVVDGVAHNKAGPEVAIRLYGINKWANENDVDIALHLHINDHGGRRYNVVGDYDGMTIYVPESQYGNANLSKEIAWPLFEELNKIISTSTLPTEDAGVAEDQELIALGASHTLNQTASLLIEYGYIYEPQWLDVNIRELAAQDFGFRTYLGLYRFFGLRDQKTGKYRTPLLPYVWRKDLKQGLMYNPDVLMLQAALRSQGLYPGEGKENRDCPLSGNFGPCTKQAVIAFQKTQKLPATGLVGPMTRTKLNQLFGK